MNTIQIQLNDKQLADLVHLIDEGLDAISERPSIHGDYSDEDMQEILRLCGEGITEIREALDNRSYLWTDSHGHIELEVAAKHVEAIAVSGDNEPACREAIENDGYLRRQLEELNMGLARAYLKEAGIEDVDSKDDDLVRVYILWMACHDINDEAGVDSEVERDHQWPVEYREVALSEGWDIFETYSCESEPWRKHVLMINCLDDSDGTFGSDEDAWMHVIEKAQAGSEVHKRALEIHMTLRHED